MQNFDEIYEKDRRQTTRHHVNNTEEMNVLTAIYKGSGNTCSGRRAVSNSL